MTENTTEDTTTAAPTKRLRITDKGRAVAALGLALDCIQSGDLDVATSQINHAIDLIVKLTVVPTIDGAPV